MCVCALCLPSPSHLPLLNIYCSTILWCGKYSDPQLHNHLFQTHPKTRSIPLKKITKLVVKIICLFVCFFMGQNKKKGISLNTENWKELSTVCLCRFIFSDWRGIFCLFFEHLTTFSFFNPVPTGFSERNEKLYACLSVYYLHFVCVRACWVCFCLSAWMCACNQPKFKNSTAVARRKQWQKKYM